MLGIAAAINSILTAIFDLALTPFRSIAPLWAIVAVSVVMGVLLVILYGQCSAQAALKKVKRRIYGALLESVLYRRDLLVSLRAQGSMLRSAFVYFLLAIPPLIVLAIPCILVLAQLNMRYNARPLRIGESALVRVEVSDASTLDRVRLETPAQLNASPALRISQPPQVWWKLTGKESGAPVATILVNDVPIAQTSVFVQNQPMKFLSRLSTNWITALLYPDSSEVSLQSSPLQSIEISYPPAQYRLLGIEAHWLVLFFVISLLSGLVAAKVLKIEV